MAISVQTFREKVIPVQVKWFDEVCEVGLRPGVWTQDLLIRMVELRFETDAVGAESEALKAIAASIAYWDILDENGDRLPVTPEMVGKLPPMFIAAIPEALSEVLEQQGKV